MSDQKENIVAMRKKLDAQAKYEDADGRPKTAKWEYCPECGSEQIHLEEGDHKQCADCYQEWFADMDYSNVVRVHLGGKYRDKDAVIERLNDELAALKAQPSGVVLPPSPYMPDVEPAQLSDYERGEAQGRCDMWAEVKRLNSSPVSLNQCDGCRAGIPAENGMHAMGIPGGYADKMMCTASRYESAPSHGEQARNNYRVVKVDAEGVQFGNAWFSHEGITRYTAEQLTSGNCRITGRAYMDWLAAAPSAVSQEQGE